MHAYGIRVLPQTPVAALLPVDR